MFPHVADVFHEIVTTVATGEATTRRRWAFPRTQTAKHCYFFQHPQYAPRRIVGHRLRLVMMAEEALQLLLL